MSNYPLILGHYKAAIVAGTRFLPFLTRNWFGFRARYSISRRPAIAEPGPHPDMLGRID